VEIWKNSDVLYDGKIVRLRVGDVTLDDGATAKREVIEHPGGVCVVAYTGASLLFVRQFRIAIGKELLELPAGKLEGVEDPAARGRQELIEEIGYAAENMVSLGAIFPTVGFCSEKIHIYLATGLLHVGQQQEQDERITVVELTLEETRRALRDHEIDDAKTIVGLYRFFEWLETAR
jgi:ADP-ribose pyrophosphatase